MTTGTLKRNIKKELSNPSDANIDTIMSYIEEYEKSNLVLIDKLNREKTLDNRRILGALKQTLHAHKVITKNNMGSAAKRIYGAMINNKPKPTKGRVIGQVMEVVMYLTIITFLFLLYIKKH